MIYYENNEKNIKSKIILLIAVQKKSLKIIFNYY